MNCLKLLWDLLHEPGSRHRGWQAATAFRFPLPQSFLGAATVAFLRRLSAPDDSLNPFRGAHCRLIFTAFRALLRGPAMQRDSASCSRATLRTLLTVLALVLSCAPANEPKGTPILSPTETKPVALGAPRSVLQRRHIKPVRNVAASSDGKLLASADASGLVLLQSRVSGRIIARIEGCHGSGMQFFGGDRFLHCGGLLWDLSTNRSGQLEEAQVLAYRPATAQLLVIYTGGMVLLDVLALVDQMSPSGLGCRGNQLRSWEYPCRWGARSAQPASMRRAPTWHSRTART